MDKTPEELFAERNQRIDDAIALKVPDRVPIIVPAGIFCLNYAGLPPSTAYFDEDAWYAANEKFMVDFAPDADPLLLANAASAKVSDILGVTQWKYPGVQLEDETAFQFVEGEYMTPSEYDHFLDDPSDFLLRVYVPRTNTNLEGLKLFPSLKSLCMGISPLTPLLLAPPVASAMEALSKSAALVAQRAKKEAEYFQRTAELGFPAFFTGLSLCPFDIISDFLRGMRGSMLDIYRRPEKLISAQEKLLPILIDLAIGMAAMTGNPRIFIPLHRGADGFMSITQFEEFYWPGLKQLITALVDAGLTPMPFFEGTYDQRLEYLRELPQGKVLCWFDRTDLFKAKEVIGDRLCIAGNMPPSLLQFGSIAEIKSMTKELIDGVGKNGGYIMCASAPLDDATPELVKAWIDYTKEYGVY